MPSAKRIVSPGWDTAIAAESDAESKPSGLISAAPTAEQATATKSDPLSQALRARTAAVSPSAVRQSFPLGTGVVESQDEVVRPFRGHLGSQSGGFR